MCGRVALGLSGATVVAVPWGGAGGHGRLPGGAWRLTDDPRESDMSDTHRSVTTTLQPATAMRLPVDWQGVPDDVIQRMELAYQEIQRRDSQAEQRAWRKDRLVQRLGLVIVALAGVLVWLVVTKHQVKAFVQTVQVTEEGRLVQLGVPQDLYDYTPPDGVYMEMVAQWVRWTRWRGEDERMTQVQWAWAYRHTCGIAHKWLKAVGGAREAVEG